MQSQGLEGRVSGPVTGALSRWREGPSPRPLSRCWKKPEWIRPWSLRREHSSADTPISARGGRVGLVTSGTVGDASGSPRDSGLR